MSSAGKIKQSALRTRIFGSSTTETWCEPNTADSGDTCNSKGEDDGRDLIPAFPGMARCCQEGPVRDLLDVEEISLGKKLATMSSRMALVFLTGQRQMPVIRDAIMMDGFGCEVR